MYGGSIDSFLGFCSLIRDSYVRFGGLWKNVYFHYSWCGPGVTNDIKILLQFVRDKYVRLFRLDNDTVNKYINLLNVLLVSTVFFSSNIGGNFWDLG